MSSYGSMSPSEEGCDRYEYEAPFYCQQAHLGSPMDSGPYWQGQEVNEYDTQDVFQENNHYIGRSYGYEDIQVHNEPYDYHQSLHHGYTQTNTALECDLPPLPLRYDRPAPSFVRIVKRRTTANKKERRRTQSINTAFSDLRECIPNVPPDTKLSKIKTLRLATSYISYLLRVLESDEPAGGFRAEIHHNPPRRRNGESQNVSSEKKGKGRTGWPQHVWALELKTEQNLPT